MGTTKETARFFFIVASGFHEHFRWQTSHVLRHLVPNSLVLSILKVERQSCSLAGSNALMVKIALDCPGSEW